MKIIKGLYNIGDTVRIKETWPHKNNQWWSLIKDNEYIIMKKDYHAYPIVLRDLVGLRFKIEDLQIIKDKNGK